MVSRAVVFVEGERRDPNRSAGARRSARAVGPLFPLANRPFLFHLLDGLDAAGIAGAVLVVAPDAESALRAAVDAAAQWDLTLEWLPLDDQFGLAQALGQAQAFLDGEPFLLHLGDSLTGDGFETLLMDAASEPGDAVVLLEPGAPAASASVVPLVGGGIGDVGPENVPALTGLAILGPDAPEAARSVGRRMALDHELITTIQRLVAAGGQARTCSNGRWWRFRGQPDSEVDANRFVLDCLHPAGPASGYAIQGNVVVHESAELESTIVRGPAIIGAGARLSHCYIGPYTSIGAGAVIEVAEVECSVVLGEATISHLERRLEDSVVGPRARVVHDFRIPRALRVNVGDGATIALS